MNDRELRRLEMLQDLDRRRLTAAAAARRRLPNVPSHSREPGWLMARLPFELLNKSPRLRVPRVESRPLAGVAEY
jgi:hypothetical protein